MKFLKHRKNREIKFLEGRKRKLSLAIMPDGDSSDLEIELKNSNLAPVVNPSGYYCFTDLPEEKQTVVLKGTGYETEEIEVDTKKFDFRKPLLNVIPKPKLFRPASGKPTKKKKPVAGPPLFGLMRIKGMVTGKGGVAIPGASIKVQKRKEATITNNSGKFVLNFNDPGVKKLKITLRIQKTGFKGRRPGHTLALGKTEEVSIILIKKT